MGQITSSNPNPLLDDKLIALLLTPAGSLPFLSRTKHLLERYGVRTIADLYSFINNDVLAFRGIGPTIAEEIRTVTQKYTQELLNEYSPEDINTALGRAQIPSKEVVLHTRWTVEQGDERLLEAFPFSVRIIHSLDRGGIKTMSDLVNTSEESLRCIKNIGEKSITQILAIRSKFLADPESVPLPKADRVSYNPDSDLPPSLEKKLELIGVKGLEELKRYSAEDLIVNAELSYPELLRVQKYILLRGADFLSRWPKYALINECDYEYIKRLGVPLDSIDISRLALSGDTDEILRQRLFITSIDALAHQSKVVLQAALLMYHNHSLNTIEKNLKSYFEWLPTQNSWEEEITGERPSPIYRIQLRATSLERILEYFLAVVPSERYRRVLELRYGLDGEGRNKLHQIGAQFNISRERVRQLEKAAINRLQRPKNNGLVQALYFDIREEMENYGGIMSVDQIGTYIESFMEIGEVQLSGTISLLLSLEDSVFTEIIPDKLWGLKDASLYLVEPLREELVKILRAQYSSLPYQKLRSELSETPWYTSLQMHAPIPDGFIRACMLTDDRFEELNDDHWSLSRWKRSKVDEIVIVLRKLGKPSHFSDITKAANELLSPEESISQRRCHAILQRKPDLFVWVGRGTYGLSEWGIKRVRFYVDIAEELIEQRGEPLSPHEIYAYVNRERAVLLENILFMLSTNHRFRRYPNDKFGLARWTDESMDEDNQVEQTDKFFDDLRKRFFDDF